MMKFNAGELAKNAIQGIQNAQKNTPKTGGDVGGLVQSVVQGIQQSGQADGGKEQVIALLRSLIAQAQKLVSPSAGKDDPLNAGICKGLALLEGQDISIDAVTKLTAELSGLIKTKSAAATEQEQQPSHHNHTPAASTASASAFSDVDASAYYADAVQWAVQNGIASGTTATTFSPDDACTRAQTVTLLWRAAGSPAPAKKDNPFTDVPAGAYYYQAVLWAVERGITAGTTATTFQPDATVTRGQVATFLYRNAGSPATDGKHIFTDVPDDAYYCKPVAWVAAKGITAGATATSFHPDAVCTRGQIVTFLYRSK